MAKISHDSETAAQGQQVITACAFIHQKCDGVEKLFWTKRADSKKFLPGVYELPGGHVTLAKILWPACSEKLKKSWVWRLWWATLLPRLLMPTR